MRRLCGGGGLELECEEAMWGRGVRGWSVRRLCGGVVC